MFVVKIYCKIETGHLLLPSQFQKGLNWMLLPREAAGSLNFIRLLSFESLLHLLLPRLLRGENDSKQSDEFQAKQPGDSLVFLHDVVFLIDRHSCVARSTGKVSEQNVNKPGKITSVSTATGNKHTPMNFYGGSFRCPCSSPDFWNLHRPRNYVRNAG